jgi:hypothetical protein
MFRQSQAQAVPVEPCMGDPGRDSCSNEGPYNLDRHMQTRSVCNMAGLDTDRLNNAKEAKTG